MASLVVQPPSPPDVGVLSANTVAWAPVLRRNTSASPPTATVTLAAHPSAAPLTNLLASLTARAPQSAVPEGQADGQVVQSTTEQANQGVVHLAVRSEPEATGAYYVDTPSDEEAGAAVEARVDSMMGDLELLFQEQLVSLAEDIAEYQAVRKGKAVAMDPSPQKDHASIMVLEEDSATADPSRPDELITLQPQGGSRWFV